MEACALRKERGGLAAVPRAAGGRVSRAAWALCARDSGAASGGRIPLKLPLAGPHPCSQRRRRCCWPRVPGPSASPAPGVPHGPSPRGHGQRGPRGGLPALEWTARPRAQSRGGGFLTRLASYLSAHSPEARGAFDPGDPAASPLGCLSLSPFCGARSRCSGRVCCHLLPLSGQGGSFEPWGWNWDLDCQEESAGRCGSHVAQGGGRGAREVRRPLAPTVGRPPDLPGTVCVFGEGELWGRSSSLKWLCFLHPHTAVCWGLCLCLFCGSSWGLV